MIQINNLSARLDAYNSKIMAAVKRVIDSGWLVLGPEVKRFEKDFSSYLDARYCITLANGTDAIELALKAMGVQKGDCVATVANAGMYTTIGLLAIGAQPFFMDVDATTCNTTLTEVKRAAAAGVKAVVITHLYGLAVPEIESIAIFCLKNGIPLLEDCAQAHGARVNGKFVGTFGDAASFSFYPTKNLGALGDGGAVVTNREEIADKVSQLRQYGWSKKYQVELEGARNSRLDEMQAAILAEILPSLDACNAKRRLIAERYSQEICNTEIALPAVRGEEYVAHLYVIRSAARDALRAYLQSVGVATDVHYPIPDYRQPIFGNRFAEIMLKSTDRLCGEILTLPCYPEMTEDQVTEIIDAINAWRP